MDEIAYVTIDVFTAVRFGGNPLAVVPDARGLDGAAMQRIATEFNYSESAFVLPPDDPANTARVRIFTPTAEIPFAGHPNVGAAFVLARQGTAFGRPVGDAMRFEERAGLVEIGIVREAGAVVGARIRAPRPLAVGPAVDAATVAACASLADADVSVLHHAPVVASVGLPFAVAELVSPGSLARAAPNPAAFAEANLAHPQLDGGFALYLYVRSPGAPERLRARMFAPSDGIPEDPATGSAAAALGALLASLPPAPNGDRAWTIEQGVEMGRPSTIEVAARVAAGSVAEVTVSGRCVPVMRGKIDLAGA